MSYRLDFVPAVSKTIAKYKKSNPNLFKKLDKILQDIQQHPKIGIGHPEPLVGGDGITILVIFLLTEGLSMIYMKKVLGFWSWI